MIYWHLAYEFFCIGAFSLGGGMATVPFLSVLSEKTGWFTLEELTRMIAISEASPGPIGVNMASYVGFHIEGFAGALVATLALTLPAFLVIFLLEKPIKRLRGKPRFEAVFAGLRPATAGLIFAVLLNLSRTSIFAHFGPSLLQTPHFLLFVVLSLALLLPRKKPLPFLLILLAAVLGGILLKL